MSLFRKIFGGKSKSSEEKVPIQERSKYMPDIKLPVDEQFTINFNKNGGKFLYCENIDEINKSLENILDENNWNDKKVFLFNDDLKDLFKSFNLKYTKKPLEGTYLFTTCESLIADDGSILISSNQIAEKKLKELPTNFIVYATTSQIVENIGEGLKAIKKRNRSNIPTNITTIKHFKTDVDKDFLSYGSSAKNLYLLLLEDL